MGVPVLSTRVSAIPELVEDGRSGILVPPGQPLALAEGMARLLVDKDLRQQVITSASRKIFREFDNRKLVLRLVTLFEQAGLKRTAESVPGNRQ
jgi:glycosyltransferase involved in cell wall biosynthesis